MYSIANHSIKKVPNDLLRDMMLNKHYLKTMPRGCKYVYGLYNNGALIGGCMIGHPVGANVEKNTLELKRFYLEPDCEKNTASWFMSRCIRDLKNITKNIITYADPREGHTGVIYKACNFVYMGKQKQGTPYYKVKGKKIWSNNIFRQDDDTIVKILSGQLKLSREPQKHIFKYSLDK